MDYQCVVVYTVINIGSSRVSDQNDDCTEGCVSWFKNKIKNAVAVHLHALKFRPNNGTFYANLACIYYKQGQIDLAINAYRTAIEVQPNFPDAYCNLANALKEKGQVSEAEECYKVALDLCPSHVDSLNNLGNLKREQGYIDEATLLYINALNIFPDFAATHSNLASLLQQQGKLDEALMHYKKAVAILPDFADAYSNMGNALREMEDKDGAIACFKQAIEIFPCFADAHCNLASMYKDIGNIKDAIRFYKNALKIKPEFADAYCNLAHCLQIICDWENYETRMYNIISIVEDQLNSDRLTSVHPHHSMLYPLSNSTRMEIASRHAKMYEEKVSIWKNTIFTYNCHLKNRIRVGYVSSDFGNHPTSHLMQSIPYFHRSDKFEIFMYALNTDDKTTFRDKIRRECEHFVDVSGVSCYFEIAKRIHEDAIDILINMNGYTKGARNEVFALRPAPIQAMWLGYPGTSGARYLDYIITDEISTPLKFEKIFTEKFAYMPYTYFIGDHKQMFPHIRNRFMIKGFNTINEHVSNIAILNVSKNYIKHCDIFNVVERKIELLNTNRYYIEKTIEFPINIIDAMCNSNIHKVKVNDLTIENGLAINASNNKVGTGEVVFDNIIITTRKQYGLPNDAVIYCNFNQLYKMNPETLNLWVQILKRVPNSVLWILSFPPSGESNIQYNARKLGLAPGRIIFSKIAPKEEHVRRAQLADICLDTPLCNGHTTTMDVLWSGTPVVTLAGETLASRVAASQLYALGCPELIAKDQEDYINIAVKLGNDIKFRSLMNLKVEIANIDSPLFDCEKYVCDMEKLYENMWQRYISGESADLFKTINVGSPSRRFNLSPDFLSLRVLSMFPVQCMYE